MKAYTTEKIRLGAIIVESQVRKAFPLESLQELLGSMNSRGQLQDIIVVQQSEGKYRLIIGERRFRAAQLGSWAFLGAKVFTEMLTETELKLIQLEENIHRADLTAWEKFEGADELLKLNRDWTQKILAEHLHIDPSHVTRILAPGKCIAEVQEALKAGKINGSDCYAISRLPAEDQPPALQKALGGATRDQLRAKPKADPNAVRMSRCKLMLPSGVHATVAGADLSLEDLIESLQGFLDAAKRAVKQSLNLKTFAATMRCQAGA